MRASRITVIAICLSLQPMMAAAQCPPGASAADDVASLKATARQLHAPLAAICKLRDLTPEQKRGCEDLLYRTSPEAKLEGDDDDDARPATGVTREHIASAEVFGEDHPNSDITDGEKSLKSGVSYVYEVTDNVTGRKFQVAGLESDFDPTDITTDYNVDASVFGAQCKTGGKYDDDFETCATKYGVMKVVHDDGRRANYYMLNPVGYERTVSRAAGPVVLSAQGEIDSPGVGYVRTDGEPGGTSLGIGAVQVQTNVLFTVKKVEFSVTPFSVSVASAYVPRARGTVTDREYEAGVDINPNWGHLPVISISVNKETYGDAGSERFLKIGASYDLKTVKSGFNRVFHRKGTPGPVDTDD